MSRKAWWTARSAVNDRPFCPGAGSLAPPREPSSLVTCPDCGRENLSGSRPPICDDDGRLVVPKHRESAQAYEWRARRAREANEAQHRNAVMTLGDRW